MKELRGKKVLVIGLGKSGLAAAKFCATAGARVVASDAKSAGELRGATKSLAGLPIEFVFGACDPDAQGDFDMVVVSPGVPYDLPGLSKARSEGVPVLGEMELAVRSIDRPIVAVTGTNGKSTTTALIGHLLKSAGMRACVAGNIGTPLLDVLDEARRADAVVLEVSSFQIETTPSLAPAIAVFLNATPDHLDRHRSFGAYVECKSRLFSQAAEGGWGVYNAADEVVSQAVMTSRCKLAPFDATGRFMSSRNSRGSSGARAWFEDWSLWVQSEGGARNRYPLKRVRLTGAHNRENMLAALVACEIMGAGPLAAGLESFEGLPHRMEFVCEHDGVRYYDDSKATNVGAAIRAIEDCAEPVILIAGGRAKGAEFSLLAEASRGRVREAVLIGEAANRIEEAFASCVKTRRANSMDEAVRLACRAAGPGDVVLLSPACSSLDMFRDYAERGDEFAKAVRNIDENRKLKTKNKKHKQKIKKQQSRKELSGFCF